MAGKRELIEPQEGDKRFVRRDESGQFSEQDDVSRSLGHDVQRDAKGTSKSGQGDRGDRNESDTSSSGSSRSGSSKSDSARGAARRRNKGESSGNS